MAEIGQKFFDNNWIDVPTRQGKRGGAFMSPTTPKIHPYILLNYTGTSRDVMTLAHELGHGIHQSLADKNGFFMSQTPLTLAETASVFGEQLTFRKLLKHEKDPKKRKAILASKIEDMINTVNYLNTFDIQGIKIHSLFVLDNTILEDFVLYGNARQYNAHAISCLNTDHLMITNLTIEEVTENSIKVQRMMEDGYDLIEAPVPCLLTVVKEINPPRIPSLKGKMAAKKAVIKQLNAAAINADTKKTGLAGSPTQVKKIFTPPQRTGGEKFEGEPQEIAAKLVKKLMDNSLI